MNCRVYVDFDGTIVPSDATDTIFERFAAPSWRDVEREWQAGKIGSRECITRQVSMLRAGRSELLASLDPIQIDPDFPEFMRTFSAAGIGITIVSDGFDLVIETLLQRYGLDVPHFANHLEPDADGRWRVSFPFAHAECISLSGHCKCSRTESHPAALKVVIGDGRSDYCIAGRADLVLAKATLLDLCRVSGTPCVPFASFADASSKLADWLAGRLRPERTAAGQGSRGQGRGGDNNELLLETNREATFQS
ncbi:MAG: MtnX-like HAD-IB family phosphatase [Hyphomicrobiaceae bacterium]